MIISFHVEKIAQNALDVKLILPWARSEPTSSGGMNSSGWGKGVRELLGLMQLLLQYHFWKMSQVSAVGPGLKFAAFPGALWAGSHGSEGQIWPGCLTPLP